MKSMRSVGRGVASDSAEARYFGASQCLRRIDSSPRSCICSSSLLPRENRAAGDSGGLRCSEREEATAHLPKSVVVLVQMHLKVPE
ncbi:hypothetical protein EJB05_40794 [Eragrostis curvula]|uniref:Uncharacterized protein n=1 Tax=Eragrostis curvula TaxID=38414 RepID=A0A5J9TQV1_9POAL|nr:hypothetical protein EJB05_40794 [Eragrostis curvula]